MSALSEFACNATGRPDVACVALRGVAWRGVAWRGVAWRGVSSRRVVMLPVVLLVLVAVAVGNVGVGDDDHDGRTLRFCRDAGAIWWWLALRFGGSGAHRPLSSLECLRAVAPKQPLLLLGPRSAFGSARAFAASLLSLPLSGTANVDGEPPLLSDVLADSPEPPPVASASRRQPPPVKLTCALDFCHAGCSLTSALAHTVGCTL